MKRVWIVEYHNEYNDSWDIDRLFNNREAAMDYIREAVQQGRLVEIESWKVYSTWPEEWPSSVDAECYPDGNNEKWTGITTITGLPCGVEERA